MRPRRDASKPGQRSVWDFPRPPAYEQWHEHVEVRFAGRTIAATDDAWCVLETSHPPTYYLPLSAFEPDVLRTLRERLPQVPLIVDAGIGAPAHAVQAMELGYDAVLLSVRIALDWRPGTAFPERRLTDPDGFAGLDGAFRFGRDGVAERALEVQEIRGGTTVPVSPAPTRFDGR